jgi:hypothetical protein
MKFYSRKFVIVVLNYSISAILTYFDKIDSLYFAVIILVTSICYLFIEGTIDFKAIKKLELDSIKYELKEEQNGGSTKNNEGA